MCLTVCCKSCKINFWWKLLHSLDHVFSIGAGATSLVGAQQTPHGGRVVVGETGHTCSTLHTPLVQEHATGKAERSTNLIQTEHTHKHLKKLYPKVPTAKENHLLSWNLVSISSILLTDFLLCGLPLTCWDSMDNGNFLGDFNFRSFKSLQWWSGSCLGKGGNSGSTGLFGFLLATWISFAGRALMITLWGTWIVRSIQLRCKRHNVE